MESSMTGIPWTTIPAAGPASNALTAMWRFCKSVFFSLFFFPNVDAMPPHDYLSAEFCPTLFKSYLCQMYARKLLPPSQIIRRFIRLFYPTKTSYNLEQRK